MPSDESPSGKKPARVTIYHFPKRAKTARRRSVEVTSAAALTSTDVRARDDELTEPNLIPELNEALLRESSSPSPQGPRTRAAEGRAAARAVPHGPARAPERARPGRKGPRRSLTPVDVDTDPAIRYHRVKVQELLSRTDPISSLEGMSRTQLGEIALFGHHLFESGRLDEARVVFEGLVGMGVEDAFPHTMLGTVYLALGDQDRALALFEAALLIDDKDVAARVSRGEIRLNRGKLKQAVDDLSAVIKVGPRDDPFVARAKRLIRMAQEIVRRHERR